MMTRPSTLNLQQQESLMQESRTFLLSTNLSDIPLSAGNIQHDTIKSAEHYAVHPEMKKLVEQALEQNPYVDHTRITTIVLGNRIVLHGKVKSWFQKEEAYRVAQLISGNMYIVNDIVISYAI